MTEIKMTLKLSAPARRVLQETQPKVLEFIAERFCDTLRHERYRDFAVRPQFRTTAWGVRQAIKETQRAEKENLHKVDVTLTATTLRSMKRLLTRGLTFAWQLEEMLLFAHEKGFFVGSPMEHSSLRPVENQADSPLCA